MELHEIIKILERIAPPELAEPWDNNGLQIDVGNNDIKKIMFTMEINEEIIDEAKEHNITTILVQPQFPKQSIEIIAKEIPNAKIVEFNVDKENVFENLNQFVDYLD